MYRTEKLGVKIARALIWKHWALPLTCYDQSVFLSTSRRCLYIVPSAISVHPDLAKLPDEKYLLAKLHTKDEKTSTLSRDFRGSGQRFFFLKVNGDEKLPSDEVKSEKNATEKWCFDWSRFA